MNSPFLATAVLCFITFTARCDELAEYTRLFEADGTYFEEKRVLQEKYRKAVADRVSRADKVEVYLLDFDAQPEGKMGFGHLKEDQFPIPPDEGVSKILSRKILNADELAVFRPALRATLSAKENQDLTLCHFPVHGVRVWAGNWVVFESSFCWKCQSFYIKYPDKAEWMNLPDPNLERVLRRIMPIPASELERFEKKFSQTRDPN
ncbi:MAG: hypothetical protein EOP84_03915 [Verrucomicrobiaceae bacterium]|nr:MAG: hypothetical protein EOP84_03915 [Verrucomicrobiaceae bacterium]